MSAVVGRAAGLVIAWASAVGSPAVAASEEFVDSGVRGDAVDAVADACCCCWRVKAATSSSGGRKLVADDRECRRAVGVRGGEILDGSGR